MKKIDLPSGYERVMYIHLIRDTSVLIIKDGYMGLLIIDFNDSTFNKQIGDRHAEQCDKYDPEDDDSDDDCAKAHNCEWSPQSMSVSMSEHELQILACNGLTFPYFSSKKEVVLYTLTF